MDTVFYLTRKVFTTQWHSKIANPEKTKPTNTKQLKQNVVCHFTHLCHVFILPCSALQIEGIEGSLRCRFREETDPPISFSTPGIGLFAAK